MLLAMLEAAKARAYSWSTADGVLLPAVALVGGLLRLIRLNDPSTIIFDETYYAKDACWYVNVSSTLCTIEHEQTQVHPPLGKWLIAIGIRIFGYNAFGWRIAAAIAGTITVALLYLLALRLLRSTTGATVSALLLALDPLHYVQSRTSMLDVFVPMFGVAAFLFLVLDRERIVDGIVDRPADPVGDRAAEGPRSRALSGRPWRLAAGAAAGAATACKWSGGLILLAVIVLSIAWEISARRKDGEGRAFLRALREETPSIVLWLFVVPSLVYLATYPGRLEGKMIAAPWAEGSAVRALVERHQYMYSFHSDLDATHSYQSPAWSWILLKRPVSYAFETEPNGDYKEILATGNPFTWWASLPALAYVLYRWSRAGRDRLTRPEGVILGGFAFTYLPWLLPWIAREAVFVFYLLDRKSVV